MGYPLLEISKYGVSGSQYTIKHSRFMSNNGELSQPESEFGYKWNVPIIFTDMLGARTIKWIETSCEGAETIIQLAENAVIDPNAKTWLRIKFSDDIIRFFNCFFQLVKKFIVITHRTTEFTNAKQQKLSKMFTKWRFLRDIKLQ
jgi:hypothetical protein